MCPPPTFVTTRTPARRTGDGFQLSGNTYGKRERDTERERDRESEREREQTTQNCMSLS